MMCYGGVAAEWQRGHKKRAERPSFIFLFLIFVFFLSLVVCMCHCRYIFLDTFDIPKLCEAFAFGSAST